ncbi:MAG: CoA-binding protein [Bacteroidetes bacterium]|nr:CoA-binding protein [Bacteroidota bacterium]MCW5895699.1 CoA-binding protein [Bacteroidota bacterium]
MKTSIQQFFASRAFGVVGVSRNSRKFGNVILREMKNKGFAVYPVSPHLPLVEGMPCLASVDELPDSVTSIVVVVHPEAAAEIVARAHTKGITNIWLQQGAESDQAIAYAKQHGLNLVCGQCILMFTEPVKSIHAVHCWVSRLVRSYPQ